MCGADYDVNVIIVTVKYIIIIILFVEQLFKNYVIIGFGILFLPVFYT